MCIGTCMWAVIMRKYLDEFTSGDALIYEILVCVPTRLTATNK